MSTFLPREWGVEYARSLFLCPSKDASAIIIQFLFVVYMDLSMPECLEFKEKWKSK
jgi:hypothetical protein